ncbi:MAG: ATP-binding protein [Thermoleophilaceae bacterium]
MAGRLGRLPIRLRLTLAFISVMTAVLLAFGAFLYLRFERDLDASLDRGLRSRVGDVAAFVRRGGADPSQTRTGPLSEQGESFAQVLTPSGAVLDGTPQLGGRPVLSGAQLARARGGAIEVEGRGPIDADEQTRILATPITVRGRRLVVAVGASLDDDEEALRNLLVLLLIGGPVALALASLAGYGVAAAALRPVEAMRRRAAELGDSELSRRLPVARSGDEIARLGETLNAMLGRLEAAFERERTFVGDASHELRTPLAILKAELELALREGRTPDELRAALSSAAEETDRVAQLAEDLLVIARSDGGRLPVRLASVDAAELIEGLRARYERRAREEKRHLTASAPAGLRLTADPLRLEQALGNVVDNALRHGAGAIEISARERAGTIELRVCDEGAGFPEDFIDRAFERFTRADTARARGGTGLGLAIVTAIAAAHGGRCGAENGAAGAEVWIALPAPTPGADPPAPGDR